MKHIRINRYEITLFIIILLLSMMIISGCSNQSAGSQSQVDIGTTNEEQEKNYDAKFLGVVKEINNSAQTIKLYDIDNDKDITLFYSGGSDIKDNYDQVISISQISLGEMVDTYYRNSDSKLVKMQISNDAWEYEGVDKLKIDNTNKIMQIVDQKYQYDPNIVVTNGEELINLIDLNDRDELTVKGVGSKIYSIIVTKGHGYIRLNNYSDFIGGTIEVGYGIIIPVTDDMLIVAREGSYKVTMENGELVGSRNVTVKRDEEVVLDMKDFHIQKDHVGKVNFEISPEGADLYINGRLVNYDEPLELNYGKHKVVVSLAGYNDYVGVLNVKSAYQTLSVNLSAATEEDTTDNGTSTTGGTSGKSNKSTSSNSTNSTNSNTSSSGTANSNSSSSTTSNNSATSNTTETAKTDKDHTITIQNPSGAKVYLDGTYKGTTPVSFTKELGTHTVSLSEDGYQTKSYTIEVEDDSENVKFSFPNMVKIQ